MASEPLERGAQDEGDLVVPEGLEAGLLAGLAVASVHAIRDWMAGSWLYTPSVLGTLLLEGPETVSRGFAAPDAAALYNLVHFAGWASIGFVAVFLVSRNESDPGRLRRILLGLSFALVAGAAAFDLWVSQSTLGRLHLWLGSLAGSLTLLGFLVWRHPQGLGRPGLRRSRAARSR
jgi:hypothetical protein